MENSKRRAAGDAPNLERDQERDRDGDLDSDASLDESLEIGPIAEGLNRRAENNDRRSSDRRRSTRGLFEFRARKEGVDRRQSFERRGSGRFRLAFWRRREP